MSIVIIIAAIVIVGWIKYCQWKDFFGDGRD